MKKIKLLVSASAFILATESFAMQYKTDTSSGSTNTKGCPGGVSDCSPVVTPTTPKPTDAPVKNINIDPGQPTQFGVRDITITGNGQCSVESVVGPYKGSPCEKIFGAKTSTSSSGTSSQVDSSSVIQLK